MKEDEKKRIYQQMTLLLDEIHRLTTLYDSWKERLLDGPMARNVNKRSTPRSIYSVEVENQHYFENKRVQRRNYDYQKIALWIASILKESGRPLSTKEIYQRLAESDCTLTYANLSSNILRKLHEDSKINVEKVTRGYWQYRFP
jgi:hypothetical protein